MERGLQLALAIYIALVLLYLGLGADLLPKDMQLSRSLFVLLSPIMPLFLIVTNFGSLIVLAPFILLLYRKHRRLSTILAIALLIDLAVTFVLKGLFMRERPEYLVNMYSLEVENSGYSMPSGHATRSFLMASLLSLEFRKEKIALFALAALVAVSRVAIGAHWVLDVFVGAANGLLLAALVKRLPWKKLVE